MKTVVNNMKESKIIIKCAYCPQTLSHQYFKELTLLPVTEENVKNSRATCVLCTAELYGDEIVEEEE